MGTEPSEVGGLNHQNPDLSETLLDIMVNVIVPELSQNNRGMILYLPTYGGLLT